MRARLIPAVWFFALAATGWSVEWQVDSTAAAGGNGTAGRPFASLQEAWAAMPGAPAEAMALHLAPGTYRITEPLELTPAQTRGQHLTVSGGGEATISGGRRLTGWKVAGGRWTLPWTAEKVRELFVNGERRQRARFPKEGWLRVAEALPDKRSGFTAQDDLPRLGPGAELVFLHDWSVSRIPVASLEGRVLRTTGPIGFASDFGRIDGFEPHPRYCLENDPVFLTEPGTWCEDVAGRRLIYLPRDGETPEKTIIEIPVAEQLLRVAGTAEKPLAGLRFEGVTFSMCRWVMPDEGYAEGQATKHVPRGNESSNGDPYGQWRFVPWAVEVERAAEVEFRHCAFRNIGGGGVLLGPATKACLLEDCHVWDVSGNGIGVGEGAERKVDGKPWWQAAPQQAATGDRVEHCLVERCGVRFCGAVGIWAGLAKDTRIARNEVRELPYTGISLGWMWNPTPTPCGGNIVEGNHIHHVMRLLSDGGGIYTLGRQPGTELRDNLIHDIPVNAGRAESNGMFLDEGSGAFTIENNLIFNTRRSPLRFHKAADVAVRHNLWVLPQDTPPIRYNVTDPATIEAKDNTVLDDAAMKPLVEAWLKNHPAP